MKKLILIFVLLTCCGAAGVAGQQTSRGLAGGTPLPSICLLGDLFVDTASPELYLCNGSNTWLKLTKSISGTFVPVLSSSGGTLPTFTTNTGTYTQSGDVVSYFISLTNSVGGTAGNGSQQISITLPFATSASMLPVKVVIGTAMNGSQELTIYGTYPASGNVMVLWRFGSSTAIQPLTTGDLNNGNIRQITLTGTYIR